MAQLSTTSLSLPVYLRHGLEEKKFREVDILAHFIGGQALKHPPACLNDAVLVGLDAEWFPTGPEQPITELGVTTTETRLIPRSKSPFLVFNATQAFHARLKATAHMIHNPTFPTYAEHFAFGTTKFVTTDEARQLLRDSFTHRRADGSLRPVIFVGHAVDNDVEAMKEKLGVDLAELDVISATLDTQTMAKELGISDPNRLIGLAAIMARFGLKEAYLHTAGNDIVWTMIVAFLLASESFQPGTHLGNDSNEWYDAAKNSQEWVNYIIKPSLSHQPAPDWGVPVYCSKCRSTEHMVGQCNVEVRCSNCEADPRHSKHAHTHLTENCGVREPRRVVIPCQLCTIHSDPQRWKHAATHTTEECRYL